jgi:hypothetical protein
MDREDAEYRIKEFGWEYGGKFGVTTTGWSIYFDGGLEFTIKDNGDYLVITAEWDETTVIVETDLPEVALRRVKRMMSVS